MRGLVGDTPDDDVGTIMVASNHICKLLLSILEGLRISPIDSPIARNLRPYQNALTFSLAHHILVVRIMSQTNKITSQFLSHSQQCTGIFYRVSTTSTIGFLLMNTDSLQEDGLTIQQNLFIASLDSTETYLVFDCFGIERDLNLIEFGIFRTPQLQFLCGYLKCRVNLSLSISS